MNKSNNIEYPFQTTKSTQCIFPLNDQTQPINESISVIHYNPQILHPVFFRNYWTQPQYNHPHYFLQYYYPPMMNNHFWPTQLSRNYQSKVQSSDVFEDYFSSDVRNTSSKLIENNQKEDELKINDTNEVKSQKEESQRPSQQQGNNAQLDTQTPMDSIITISNKKYETLIQSQSHSNQEKPQKISDKLEIPNKYSLHLSQDDLPKNVSTPMVILCKIIKELFYENQISNNSYKLLPKFQRKILYYLVRRQFTREYEETYETDEVTSSFEKLDKLKNKIHLRNCHENLKFILLRIVKYLRRLSGQKDQRKLSDVTLYKIYYIEIAEKLNIPMDDFFFPLTGLEKGKIPFNLSYVREILQSRSFIKEIELYCKDAIFDDFKNELADKIDRKIINWDRILRTKSTEIEKVEKEILRFIVSSRGFKLPFTKNEVKTSIESMMNLIKTCNDANEMV